MKQISLFLALIFSIESVFANPSPFGNYLPPMPRKYIINNNNTEVINYTYEVSQIFNNKVGKSIMEPTNPNEKKSVAASGFMKKLTLIGLAFIGSIAGFYIIKIFVKNLSKVNEYDSDEDNSKNPFPGQKDPGSGDGNSKTLTYNIKDLGIHVKR